MRSISLNLIKQERSWTSYNILTLKTTKNHSRIEGCGRMTLMWPHKDYSHNRFKLLKINSNSWSLSSTHLLLKLKGNNQVNWSNCQMITYWRRYRTWNIILTNVTKNLWPTLGHHLSLPIFKTPRMRSHPSITLKQLDNLLILNRVPHHTNSVSKSIMNTSKPSKFYRKDHLHNLKRQIRLRALVRMNNLTD